MSRLRRLAALAVLIWIIAAALSWWLFEPGSSLVGQRKGQAAPKDFSWLKPPALEEAKATLEMISIWGTQRNGQPFPPVKLVDQKEAEKLVKWKALAVVLRKNERYVLVQIEGKQPVAVMEGDTLPDETKLLKANKGSYTIQTMDGKTQTIFTNL
jgi:hypothetical protein